MKNDDLHKPAERDPLRKPVLWSTLALTILVAVGFGGSWLIYARRNAMHAANGEKMFNAEAESNVKGPRYDEIPFELGVDIKKHRQETAKHLESYRWVDQSGGRVAIPIDQAINAYVQDEQKRGNR